MLLTVRATTIHAPNSHSAVATGGWPSGAHSRLLLWDGQKRHPAAAAGHLPRAGGV